MTEPNKELLQELVSWVNAEAQKARNGKPSQWQQAQWLERSTVDWPLGDDYNSENYKLNWNCGTACCAAGHVALSDGLQPDWSHGDSRSGYVIDQAGVRHYVPDYAQGRLGLTDDQRDVLFAPDNTSRDIELIVEAILGGTFRFEAFQNRL